MGDTHGNQYRRFPSLWPSSIIASPSCMSQYDSCSVSLKFEVNIITRYHIRRKKRFFLTIVYLTSSNVSSASMARPEVQDSRLSTSSTVTNP